MGLKDTLRMPKTDFPMRAGLAQKEPVLVANWQNIKLYEKMNADREGCEEFQLHDGPPYANGDMHCGHALNRCLKDFVIRYKNMAGYRTPFVFGWDTHGLPIEVKVTKSGVDRKKTPVAEFRSICEQYARTQVERQKKQIMRLGCLGDYEHPYLTLLPEFEARQIDVFAKMALKGLIFKGSKPVYWSWSSESALAEAEVEYHDVEAKTIYVTMDVKDGKGLLPSDAKFVIWTTTPWTLPSNQGITVNPRFEYGLFDTMFGKLVFLASLKDRLVEELGLGEVTLLKTFKGEQLERVTCYHPLYRNKESLVMCASFVSDDAGTGCVHTDPDHGLDDFNVSAKYGLKPQGFVDEKGIVHMEEGNPLNGMFYDDTQDVVIDMLNKEHRILKREDIVHSYPHDWRTKKPVIFRATPQWFCSISPIRERLLEAIKEIQWVPAWGEAKMVNMIKDRADWCISRQRVWGVPIPIIYNEDGSPILEEAVFNHIRDLVAKEGSNVWFKLDAKDLLPEGYSNPASPHGRFTKETDIMDVWFDSGSSWNGTLVERGMKYPCDLYLEGNDQYRGWFNSSLIVSIATNDVSPFKACLTHGFVMDEAWQKMSKSAGNGIDPNKIMDQFGADILRLWAASVDFTGDARLGENLIGTVTDNYRKIRNTFKFMLGNLEGVEAVDPKDYSLVDRFILARLEQVKNKVLAGYEAYDFRSNIDAIMTFMSNDLSSFYLDLAKDILYCDAPNSVRRKAMVAVIYECCKTLCYLLNPIIPFTMEEVYGYLPVEHKASVQLEAMPKESHDYEDVLPIYEQFRTLRDKVLLKLEAARQENMIGSSSLASLDILVAEESLFNALSKLDADTLAKTFIVSKVALAKGSEDDAKVSVAKGCTCARCRFVYEDTKESEEGPLCPRCLSALGEFHE